MKIAHFSDTHLGFRAYGRINSYGQNQRESDVFRTFRRFLESIHSHDPDVVLHTGDFFHVVRPSNQTILGAFSELSRFQSERRNKPLIIIAGNHESPRTVETNCILKLFGNEDATGSIGGIFVFVDSPRGVLIEDVEFLLLPSRALAMKDTTLFEPDSRAKASVLAAHGLDSSLGYGAADFDQKEFNPERWSYLALGDYHVFKEIGKTAAYSGSTDYTSSNIWEEIETPKGWVLYDSDTGTKRFIQVDPVRAAIDLPVIDAEELSVESLESALLTAVTWGEDEQPIVRQRVINAEPGLRAKISSKTISEIKARCLYYRFDLQMRTLSAPSEGASHLIGGLDDEWRKFASSIDLPKGVSREQVVETGRALMQEASVEADTD